MYKRQVDKEKYADANLQQDNSIMAIGSGMLKGKWEHKDALVSVKNGGFLSEEQTDFIFAVIGEDVYKRQGRQGLSESGGQ